MVDLGDLDDLTDPWTCDAIDGGLSAQSFFIKG